MNPVSPESADLATADVYWAGPSGYAVLPTVILGGLLSLGVFFGSDWLGDVLHLAEHWTSVVRFWVILIPWAGVGLLWTYRAASFQYRVTARHLHLDYGMAYRPVAPIARADLVDVRVSQWWWQRLFRYGTVVATPRGGPPIRMRLVHRPERLAMVLRSPVISRSVSP